MNEFYDFFVGERFFNSKVLEIGDCFSDPPLFLFLNRHHAGHGLSVSRDGDFLATLHPVEELWKMCFCLVLLNDKPVPMRPEKPRWLAAKVKPSLMKKGPNILAVAYRRGKSASVTITSVELAVDYQN